MTEQNLNGSTPNIAEENIEKLKQIFPDAFAEGRIDFDKLKQDLGEYIDEDSDRYNFTWHGKGQALRLAQTPSTGTLCPCIEESKNWDTTQNLYIEGDNLEVLKLLQKSYHGKVKMIYIDPPYNTGNDFVYPDDYKDNLENYLKITGQVDEEGKKIGTNREANGRYHTDWLNMMYPRLRLARNLLTDDGVIFISIDDNEQDNLKKLCNEVFGEENFIGAFIINAAPNARDYGHIGKMHEYVLFYAKNVEKTSTNMIPEVDKTFKYCDNKGGYNIHPLYNSNEAFNNLNRPNLFYPFYLYLDEPIETDFFKIGLEKKTNSIEIYPPCSLKNNVQFVWRWGKEKALQYMNIEIIGYKTSNNEYRIVQKMRNSEKIIRSVLSDTIYSSRRGTAEVENLLKGKFFPFPKPLSLLNDFVRVGSSNDSTILDFFSGSSTTAHAAMQLNAEDGGNRKFIMVQLPEPCDEQSEAFKAGYKNICEIGKERIRRAGEKMKEELTQKQNGQTSLTDDSPTVNPDDLDIGFKVLKLDSSNLKKWNPDYDNLAQSLNDMVGNYVPGRTELDVVYEIMLKYGLQPTLPVDTMCVNGKNESSYNIYSIGCGALIICLCDDITEDVANSILKLKEELSPETCRVVFKDNGFKDDSVKTNTIEILKLGGIVEFVTV